MDPALKDHVHVGDAWQFLARGGVGPFDRVVMLDVLEHFSAADGVRLLEKIKAVLAPDGLVVVRVPNMGSPWGGIHQFSDLTHKSAYTTGSLEQLALAAGYEAVAFLPQRRGSPFRRFAEDCLHWLLARMLATAPTVWTANVIAVLRPAAKK
jgi:cyclopropane fatty-acyl-phospholipid synthase-like methyltransferase